MVAPGWWGKHGRKESGEITGAGQTVGKWREQGDSGMRWRWQIQCTRRGYEWQGRGQGRESAPTRSGPSGRRRTVQPGFRAKCSRFAANVFTESRNVSTFFADVSTFEANVSSFQADVSTFQIDVSTFRADVSSASPQAFDVIPVRAPGTWSECRRSPAGKSREAERRRLVVPAVGLRRSGLGRRV